MIINNSKKALAAKIRNSGFVWPDSGKWAIQDKDGEVFVCSGTSVPVRRMGEVNWGFGEPYRSVGILSLGSNWFQCILSRDEYFHLYPAPVEVVVENKTTCHLTVADKPTIEQLAADYSNVKDYADRKQQEADAAKADAEAKLAELVAAGKALGLLVSPIAANQESELAIEVKVGDEVECVVANIYPEKYIGMVGTVLDVDDSSTPYLVNFGGCKRIWCHKVKFIRRP